MGVISIYESEVSCLFSVLDLQRQCISENIGLSPETNKHLLYLTLERLGPSVAQKVVSKLVAQGEIKWKDEEDFEVEQILDCVEENGIEYFHIKWRGWSHAYNTWEPKHNLECPDLMAEYYRRNQCGLLKTKPGSKRKYDEINDGIEIANKKPKVSVDVKGSLEFKKTDKRMRIDELYYKLIQHNDNLTPLKLISQASPDKKIRLFKANANTQVPKFKNKLLNASHKLTNPKTKAYREAKGMIGKELKDWEKYLNSVCTDPAPIIVENNVDLEGPPENFIYINDYKPADGITIPDDPVIGCECTDCYAEKGGCCAAQFGVEFAYFKYKRLRVHPGRPIYECNKKCLCGPDCPNRVVQQGRKHKVCVFRTSNSRGWGVKTLQKIKAGTFVMEYVGEVISSEEAEIRGHAYDAVGRTYLFDLDFSGDDCPFTVDAAVYGNVSHFVNHSCDPNMEVYSVWINTLDTRLPRIALFSRRDIEKGEELTFDYMSCKAHTPLEESPAKGPAPTSMPASNGNVSDDGDASITMTTTEANNGDTSHPVTASGDSATALETGNQTSVEMGEAGSQDSVEGVKSGALPISEGKDTGDKANIDDGAVDSTVVKTAVDSEDSTAGKGKGSVEEPDSKEKNYRMVCQCGAAKCRKFVF